MPVVEVGTVISVLTVDAALQHTCAIFRERADRGDITPAERDLLIDGAILLAMHLDDLAQDGRTGSYPSSPERLRPEPPGRHERQVAAAAA
jgi:hypothetical protein